jgi:hypothetical protein
MVNYGQLTHATAENFKLRTLLQIAKANFLIKCLNSCIINSVIIWLRLQYFVGEVKLLIYAGTLRFSKRILRLNFSYPSDIGSVVDPGSGVLIYPLESG